MPQTLDGSIDAVIDVYHGSKISLADAKSSGIIAVIHKASEGATLQDDRYAKRRHEARGLGLLWGAYHYASGMPVQQQVDNFLGAVQWGADSEFDARTLLCLDFEASHSGPDMTFDDVCVFVKTLRDETGRWPMLYGGAVLRETSGGASSDCNAAKCPLWYARYNDKPVGLPLLWRHFALWQYTDGAHGPLPRSTGAGNFDRSCFMGSADELKNNWPNFTS